MYHNGEPITAKEIQDEPWYSDFSSAVNVFCAGPTQHGKKKSFFERLPNGEQAALKAIKEYFKKYPGPPGWNPPDDARILRWIRGMWMTEEQMSYIEELDRGEILRNHDVQLPKRKRASRGVKGTK
jgi:hypothetical protein